jgi:hypothetical protein
MGVKECRKTIVLPVERSNGRDDAMVDAVSKYAHPRISKDAGGVQEIQGRRCVHAVSPNYRILTLDS